MKRTTPTAVSCLFLLVMGYNFLLAENYSAHVSPTSYFSIPNDTLVFTVPNCDDQVTICLDSVPLTNAVNLEVLVNGAPYAKTIMGCNFDTISAYTYSTLFGQGNSGPYNLRIWRVGDSIYNGIFQNIPDLVDSMNLWDPLGNWTLDETTQLVSGGVGGTSYSDMAVEVVATSTQSFIGYNFGMEANGLQLSFGTGIHRISIFDSLNNTVRKATVAVACVGQTTVKGRVLPNETKEHCLDFGRLLGPLRETRFCAEPSQTNTEFVINANDSCVSYTGKTLGMDTTCIIACDIFGFCDTTYLLAETYDVPHYRETTINLAQGNQQTYCLDTTVIAASINQFFNGCTEQGGNAAELFFDTTTYCVTAEGEVPASDTACIIICNTFGQCDTSVLFINVFPRPTTETIDVVMGLNDSLNLCPSNNELAGNVTGINNFCENNSTETIIFTVNNVDLCFGVTAQSVGTDSICAVICDNFLICDTTYYLISVTATTPSLIATPDLDTSSINSPVTLNVLGNDSIPNGTVTAMDLILVDGTTSNGTQTINPDGTVLFTPDTDFCGEESQFQYRICNTINCDTATVRVYVSCAAEAPTRMRFYTGFSPNGDGVNDFFRIEGIADYPNNELSVFNRWGTQVFKMKGYKNAWDGTWQDSILPNGTYFYVLKNGNGAQYSGFVQIQR